MTLTTWLRRITITLLSFGLTALSAQADDTSSQSYELDIDALPLTAAVKTLSDETGIEVLFFSEIAEGVTSSPVQGEYTPTEALETMLNSTDLKVVDLKKEGAVAIAMTATDERGASDSKNSSPAPILMAQNTAGQTPTTESSRSEEDGTGIVTGRVTDARTGANLKGAKVSIEETGQWTSTNDLGEFRFVNVPIGSATLTVSFLGYAGQSAVVGVRSDGVSQDFLLRGGSEIEEIVVFGQRSARALALNQERTAPNSTNVLSSDLLGTFNGTTISEALRRAPGVAFVPDPESGDGANVIVRGIGPDLNQVTLNGIRLLDGTGEGRSPDLSTILTESIKSVVINKSLLPSQDSNGAGALIEIETKSPLDRDRRFTSFFIETGGISNDFQDELNAGVTLSRIFGASEDFGLGFSASYRDRETTRTTFDVDGFVAPEVYPAGITRFTTRDVDPRLIFPLEDEFNDIYPNSVSAFQGSLEDELVLLTASAQKRIANHTDLKFDLTYTQRKSTNYDASTTFSAVAGIQEIPIDELNGETRTALISESPFGVGSFVGDGLFGTTFREAAFIPDREEDTTTLSFRGETSLRSWDFTYSFGYTESQRKTPSRTSVQINRLGLFDPGVSPFLETLPTEFVSSEALANTRAGRVISVFAPLHANGDVFVLPLLSGQGFEFYNTLDSLSLNNIVRSTPASGQGDSLSLEIGLKQTLDWKFVKTLEFGISYEDIEFSSNPIELSNIRYQSGDGVLLSDLGFAFGPGILSEVGAAGDFDRLTRQSVEGVVNNLIQLEQDGLLISTDTTVDPRPRQTIEKPLAGYFQVQALFGDLEIIGGVRVEHLELESASFLGPRFTDQFGIEDLTFPDQFGEVVTQKASQTDFLPRLLVNYRFDEDLILRASYYTTVSRPQINNITNTQRFDLDLEPNPSFGNRPTLDIIKGNPNLKNSYTHSFGLDFEKYFGSIGVWKMSAFYKTIENPLQSNRVVADVTALPEEISIPDIPFYNDLPEDIFVRVTQPLNSDENNEIWGAELVVERQFDFLPGMLGGFGVYANYTYTDSDSVQQLTVPVAISADGVVELSGIPFEGSPKHQGTFGMTYSYSGFDGSLLYSAQSRRFDALGDFRLDQYDEAIETLDFRLDYFRTIGDMDVRFYLRGEDLLRSKNEPYLTRSIGGESGVSKYFTGATFFGGRTFALGVSTIF